MSARKKKTRRGAGTITIGICVIAFLAVMSVQIYRVKEKHDDYAEREKQLKNELQAQMDRSEEIDALEDYMQSDEYIEDTAKNKLGLAYENQLIFKESGD